MRPSQLATSLGERLDDQEDTLVETYARRELRLAAEHAGLLRRGGNPQV